MILRIFGDSHRLRSVEFTHSVLDGGIVESVERCLSG